MKTISDINIIGIDTTRPPIIRKEPYIDLFFELSHQAPTDWCKDLNSLFGLNPLTKNSKISENEGLFIITWVRAPEEITALVLQLKRTITECSLQYIERIQLAAQQPTDTNTPAVSAEQANLNKIISSLNFD